MQELLKHSVDGAMGPSVDTLRARFDTFPKDDLGERTVSSRKKGGILKQSPMTDASLQLGSIKTFNAEQSVQPHRDHKLFKLARFLPALSERNGVKIHPSKTRQIDSLRDHVNDHGSANRRRKQTVEK